MHLLIAAFVLVAILLITKFGKGFVVNIAVLLGIVMGFCVAWVIGKVSFTAVSGALAGSTSSTRSS